VIGLTFTDYLRDYWKQEIQSKDIYNPDKIK